jgi:hypothetical protein
MARLGRELDVSPLVDVDCLRDTITIVAGRQETILYEGRPMRPSELRGHAIIVRAESGAKYQDVVHAIDVARGSGARAVGLSR